MLNKKTYTRFLFPITVVLLIAFIAISRSLWGVGDPAPEVFSDYWETISGLGNMDHNPKGFIYFQLWGCVFGVFILHITRYIHDRMMLYRDYPVMFFKVYLSSGRLMLSVYYLFGFIPIYFVHIKKVSFPVIFPFLIFIETEGKSALYGALLEKDKSEVLRRPAKAEDFIKLGTFFLLMGGIGFVLMGVIPDGITPALDETKLHEVSAGIGFGGILFANILYANSLDQVARAGKVSKKIHYALQGLWWFLILGVLITYPIAEFYYKEKYDLGWYDPEWGEAGVPWIFSFSVWERIGFIVGCAYLGGMGYLLPKKGQNADDSNKERSADELNDSKQE